MTTESPEAGSVTPEPLMQMMQGMHVTAILQEGVRLGIFDHTGEGNTDAATIPSRPEPTSAAPGFCWTRLRRSGC